MRVVNFDVKFISVGRWRGLKIEKMKERKRSRDWVTGLGPDDVINSQASTHFLIRSSGSVDVRSPRLKGGEGSTIFLFSFPINCVIIAHDSLYFSF
jgi:hypothetical protein